ncbi:MAG: hypothetical protein IPG90_01860 [Bacteroidetes bacterium]|nr:hypothetical protein [Bacteroidota bacterium]
MIRERRGFLWLGTYSLESRKYEEGKLFNFEKVLDFAYSDDGLLLVMSAVQKGQSDIFVYNLRTRTFEQITKDFYDDLHPRFINHSSAIVFSSNRINDTLEVDKKAILPGRTNFDVFFTTTKPSPPYCAELQILLISMRLSQWLMILRTLLISVMKMEL